VDERFLSLAYTVFPFVAPGYGLVAYLRPRAMSRKVVWLGGLVIAGALIAAVTSMLQKTFTGVGLVRLATASAIMYGLPMLVVLLTVIGIQRWIRSRWLGVLVLIVVAAAAQFVAYALWAGSLGLVNASG